MVNKISRKEIAILLLTIPGIMIGLSVNDIVKQYVSLEPGFLFVIGVAMFLIVAYFVDR